MESKIKDYDFTVSLLRRDLDVSYSHADRRSLILLCKWWVEANGNRVFVQVHKCSRFYNTHTNTKETSGFFDVTLWTYDVGIAYKRTNRMRCDSRNCYTINKSTDNWFTFKNADLFISFLRQLEEDICGRD